MSRNVIDVRHPSTGWLPNEGPSISAVYSLCNLTGISLIALLRLGLLSEVKARLYEQFIKMPLYEDMAPWNIGTSAKLLLLGTCMVYTCIGDIGFFQGDIFGGFAQFSVKPFLQ